jgi:hypothetical protein
MKLVIEDAAGTRSVVPFNGGEILVGRSAEGNTLRLTDRNVSRRHARFLFSNGTATVEDLGSLTGTRVNGERIGGRRRLREGDLIEIGDYDLAVIPDEGLAGVAGPGTPPPLPGPAGPQLASPARPAAPQAPLSTAPQRSVALKAQPAPRRRPILLLAACILALALGAAVGLLVGNATSPSSQPTGIGRR